MKHGYRFFLYLLSGLAIITIGACNLYNPPEQIPAYIHIEKIDLTTEPVTEGSNSSKITDAWVYVDDQLIGCFELPCTFPVLFEGDHQVMVRAGIKVNGIAASRAPYPFFDSYRQLTNLQPGTTATLSPSVTYVSSANFEFMENFEGSGIVIDSSAGTDTLMQRLYLPDPNVFEGTSSGVAWLDNTNTFFECVSSQMFTLPKGGKDIFLEFNYKSNHEFVVGVIAQPPYYLKTSSITYNPSSSWNKTYLYLTTAVSGSPGATQFKVFFGMQNSAGLDSVALMLDNIKLIY